jgi:hypothetical protein
MMTLTLTALTRRNRMVPAVRKFFREIADSIEATLAGIDDARAMATRYETLSRLSDSELAQRGISRSDIPRIVLESARQR